MLRRIGLSIFILCLTSVTGSSIAKEVPFVAFGEMRGYLEPCGCDPKNDLGGARRILESIEQLRIANPTLHVYNLGNNLSLKDIAKNKLINDSIRIINPTASLISELELKNALNSGHIPHKNSILSNYYNPKKFKTHITKNGITIFGYLSPKISQHKKSLISLEKFIALARKTTTKNQKTLLFWGTKTELKHIVSTKVFSRIIRGSEISFDQEATQAEKNNEGSLLQFNSYQVPTHGQGILLADSTRRFKVNLGDFQATKTPSPLHSPILEFHSPYIWLNYNFDGNRKLDEIFNKLSEEKKSEYLRFVENNSKTKKPNIYAGAEACEMCHKSSYDIWKKTDHFHALDTLQSRNKHQDLECVSCHVVGLSSKKGFLDKEKTPHLAGVQCENCHGPRLEHIKNPSIKSNDNAKDICTNCHKEPHQSNFDFSKYWPKIKH